MAGVPSNEEIVGMFLAVMSRMKQHLTERSAEFDLSQPQAIALLELERPRSMKELAEQLSCDASNVTGIVDRLEERGLVTRQVLPEDRRVKQLVLTDEGQVLWQKHHERVFGDVPLFAGLSDADRRQLVKILGLLVGEPG